MKRARLALSATAISLTLFAASAMAAPGPTLEIDFTSVLVPLSPALSMLIAVALGGLGVHALRRTRGSARVASWLLFVLAALPLAAQVAHMPLVSEARAVLIPDLPLAASPTLQPISATAYEAINQTGVNITLTVVQVNNGGGGYSIYAPFTTCAVGTMLPPGGRCEVFLVTPG